MKQTIGKGLAFLLGVVLAVTAIFLIAAAPAKDEPSIESPIPVYPTNANGESYGIAADNHEYDPDLIAAIGEDGVEGYFRYNEAHPEDPPKTPEEALAWQEAYQAKGGFHYIDLYDKEGNIIGKMRIESDLENFSEITVR